MSHVPYSRLNYPSGLIKNSTVLWTWRTGTEEPWINLLKTCVTLICFALGTCRVEHHCKLLRDWFCFLVWLQESVQHLLVVIQFKKLNLFRFKHRKRPLWPLERCLTREQCQILMIVFSKQSGVLFMARTDRMEVSRVRLYSVSICVFAFCWKPAGALSYILCSKRELKPFKVETEYWQYVNRRGGNMFLRERRALKESKWIDHTRLAVFLFPYCIL